jgi:AMMECR1 domain-containing protein/orotate phosphoribosyltransferase
MTYLRGDMKSVLASLPAPFHADRAELLQLLLKKAILHRSETQPVLSADGRSGRWMLNSLAVTLEPRGAELAGRCLLPLLERFDGRQLATYGLIGVPILQSCILQSGGRYRGLLIRKDAKPHGSMRVIEGEIDPDEPVILLDDSIVSGKTFWEGCHRLQEAGLRVEGGVCLVRFGWPFGVADAQERGLHVEALFDLYDDLMANMEGEEKLAANPSKVFPEFQWSAVRAEEGLHPAHLARVALREYLRTGLLLRPPERLDGHYDSAGGAWVSLRPTSNIYLRHARDGFWHFPGEPRWTPAEDVLRAVILTAQKLPRGAEGLSLLESSHIAVTFFSELEECTVGEIDNDRHGIVVGSRERTGVMGGALPRMPGIGAEYRLFQHARITNGKLLPFEPYMIHRHGVMKYVEPGAPWQPTGVPVPAAPAPWQDPTVCEPIANRARDICISQVLGLRETTTPLLPGMRPDGLNLLFVTVYLWGQLRGCAGMSVTDLDSDLRRLVQSALMDERFADVNCGSPEAIAVSITLLHNCANLGQSSPEEVVRYVVTGRQALQVTQNQRSGIVLPFWAAMHSLSAEEYALEVVDKAGITRPPYYWQRFDCATWLADAEGVGQLEGAFKPMTAACDDHELARWLTDLYANYLLRHHRQDGTSYESYEPFRNRLLAGGNLPRLAHGAWVLMRGARVLDDARLRQAADRTVDLLLRSIKLREGGVWLEMGENVPSVSEISFLVLALCELPAGDYRRVQARGLADSLWSTVDRHGRITTHFTSGSVEESFQDYFPGQALLALARAARSGLTEVDDAKLERALGYYRHRFRYQRNFGQVSWLMQAFSAWWDARHEPSFSAMVFEIGDWLLQYQQQKSGAFLSEDQPESPGYTTAIYLEAICAGARLAEEADPTRHRRYLAAYFQGLRFLYRITIQPQHASVLPNTDYAVGGLRMSLDSSFIRVDFVQHGLSSVLELRSQPSTLGETPRSSIDAYESTAV